MKIVLAVGSSLLAAAFFQLPAIPPMKMGLWESSVSSKMTGMDMPPQMAAMMNRVTTVRSCLTPESYAKSVANNSGKDCNRTNEVWTGKSYTADIVCRSGKGHFEIHFETPENAHGTSSVSMNAGGHDMKMDADVTMHYLGADCERSLRKNLKLLCTDVGYGSFESSVTGSSRCDGYLAEP